MCMRACRRTGSRSGTARCDVPLSHSLTSLDAPQHGHNQDPGPGTPTSHPLYTSLPLSEVEREPMEGPSPVEPAQATPLLRHSSRGLLPAGPQRADISHEARRGCPGQLRVRGLPPPYPAAGFRGRAIRDLSELPCPRPALPSCILPSPVSHVEVPAVSRWVSPLRTSVPLTTCVNSLRSFFALLPPAFPQRRNARNHFGQLT